MYVYVYTHKIYELRNRYIYRLFCIFVRQTVTHGHGLYGSLWIFMDLWNISFLFCDLLVYVPQYSYTVANCSYIML